MTTQLLERDEQLATMTRAITSGTGHVVLVAGEAGMGKTALVTEFARRTRDRVRVLWGACDPLGTPRPLGPLHDVGRQAGGALAEALAGGASRERVFAALLDTLDGPGRIRPVVVLEDLHWADEATLDAVMFLGRRLGRVRGALIGTFRSDEVSPQLRAALSALPPERTRRIPLVPISAAGVADWAQRTGRRTAELHAVTGGNPLLVSEVLAAGTDGVPPSVRDLMAARLHRLPEPAQEIARLVSVVPGRTEPYLLGDGSSVAVEACLAGGVLVSVDDGLAYRHELLRRAAADDLSPSRRMALNATVLARLTAQGSDPARLAHHARAAADVPAQLVHGPPAARAAAAVGAHREAAGQLRPLLPHLHRLPVAERAELLEIFAIEAQAAGYSEEAIAALRRLLPLREGLGDPERTAGVLGRIGRSAWWAGHVGESWAAARRAVAMLETIEPSGALARAYGHLAARHMLDDEPVAAITWAEKGLQLATRLGDEHAVVTARINIGSTLIRHFAEDGGELERAHAQADAAGIHDEATRALVNMGSSTLQANEHGRATPMLDRAIAYALDHDLHGFARFVLGMRARLRVETGDWAGAQADAEQSIAWPGTRSSQVPGLVALGLMRLRRGDPSAVDVLDVAAEYVYPMQEMQWVGPVAAARSEMYLLAGNAEKAMAEAVRWLPRARERHHPHVAGELAWRAWLASGEPSDAGEIDPPYDMAMSGDWAGAVAVCRDRGRPWAAAEASMLGDEAAVAEAIRTASAFGAVAVAQRRREEAVARGMRPPRGPRPATAAHPAGLTPRQTDVLELLAEGLTNAEIADRLVLSIKTTGHHVSAVLSKLGASNRLQAVAKARTQGLLTESQYSE